MFSIICQQFQNVQKLITLSKNLFLSIVVKMFLKINTYCYLVCNRKKSKTKSHDTVILYQLETVKKKTCQWLAPQSGANLRIPQTQVETKTCLGFTTENLAVSLLLYNINCEYIKGQSH
jgi:hypothetical protein